MTLSAREQDVKQEFIRRRGYWREWTEILLKRDPDFLEEYASFASYATESGPLSKRMVELIYVALDASAAHMFTRGLELHLEMAIKSGATQHDLCDVFRVVTEQGASAALASEGILAEELSAAGFNMAAPDPEFEVRRERLCARIGTSGEGLSRKEYALIRVALHGAFTSPVPDALRKAIRDALREQASAEEIRQALRMTGHLAVHACAVGLPVFEKVLTRGGVG